MAQKATDKFSRILLDPAAAYSSPTDVLADERLSTLEKTEVLRRWEYDARELSVAGDDFTCLACRRHGPDDKRLSRLEYNSRRHVVVRYFEHQMAFEDEDVLRKFGIQRKRHVTVWSYSLVPLLICGTPMISTVPTRIADQLAARWPITLVPFPFDHQPVRIFAYWQPSRDGDSVLANFLRCIREVVPD